MSRATAVAVHALSVIAVATIVSAAYAAFQVHTLGTHDPKFGARGTVELVTIIALASGSVAALGAALSHALFIRDARRSATPLISAVIGAAIGVVVATTHTWVIHKAPTIPHTGFDETVQYCVYLFAMGVILNRIAVATIARIAFRAAS